MKRPVVAQASRKTPASAVAGTFAVLGLGIFFWLSSARAAQDERGSALPALAAAATAPAPQEAPAEARPIIAAAAPVPVLDIPNTIPIAVKPSPMPQPVRSSSLFLSPTPGLAVAPPIDPMRDRARAPTLVIDMAQAEAPRLPGSTERVISDSGAVQSGESSERSTSGTVSGGSVAVGQGAAASGVNRNLSDTEQFAARVGSEESQDATARRMVNLDRTIPQGAIIGAVMETALNSDQPGFARALTARDAYSFDGSTVLIPAGSRLIGQYKSGVAQGGSRLFVLWTRLIRPDGVSIELGSPAVDDLGRGGIGGKVNRHFIQRFGGAILTSVLSGGISAFAASRANGSTIVVNSAGQASTLASQAGQSSDIPPTITTRQGAAVRIFVARDLDFTRVGPVR